MARPHISARRAASTLPIFLLDPGTGTSMPFERFSLALGILLQAVLLVALVGESRRRARAQRELDEHRRWARLIGELSAELVDAPADELETQLGSSVGRVLEPLDADGAYLVQFEEEEDRTGRAAEHPPRPVGVARDTGSTRTELPFCESEIRRGHMIGVSRLEELPAAAVVDRRALQAAGMQAMLAVPLHARGHLLGFLALLRRGQGRAWPEALVTRVQLVGDMLANALLRRWADHVERESEAVSTAVAMAVAARFVVLDRAGVVTRVSDAWLDAAPVLGISDGRIALGTDYLAACRAAIPYQPVARLAVEGIESALDGGGGGSFTMEYSVTGSAGERWYELVVVPLPDDVGGVLTAHLDCTARKQRGAARVDETEGSLATRTAARSA